MSSNHITINGRSFNAEDVMNATTFQFAKLSERNMERVLMFQKVQACTTRTIITMHTFSTPSTEDSAPYPRYEYPVGTNGEKCCDACSKEEDFDTTCTTEGSSSARVCPRCKYAASGTCARHPGFGTCYCKDSNFGGPYPAERQWFMHGRW
jgi:hypothetical protein